MDGQGHDASAAAAVVAEIVARGGEAMANDEDVSVWDGGRRLVEMAIDTFGDLHVLVNNAGILRDRALVNMTEDEWDDVIAVHLKGHFVPTRHAAAYWRRQAKAGVAVTASVINTSSTSGLLGNPFQTNYGAAKAGIGAFTIIAAHELVRYGVRVNAIVPAARTRLTSATEGLHDMIQPPADGAFDVWDPANVSPLVGWLATERCRATGKVFYAQGGTFSSCPPGPWVMGWTGGAAGRSPSWRTNWASWSDPPTEATPPPIERTNLRCCRPIAMGQSYACWHRVWLAALRRQ